MASCPCRQGDGPHTGPHPPRASPTGPHFPRPSPSSHLPTPQKPQPGPRIAGETGEDAAQAEPGKPSLAAPPIPLLSLPPSQSLAVSLPQSPELPGAAVVTPSYRPVLMALLGTDALLGKATAVGHSSEIAVLPPARRLGLNS